VCSVIYGCVLTPSMREAEHDQATRGYRPAAKVIPDRRHLEPRRRHRARKAASAILADQGYPAARFWTEPLDERFAKIGTYEVYQVKCNLVNGLPPRYRDESH
jgi:hypothetical protein